MGKLNVPVQTRVHFISLLLTIFTSTLCFAQEIILIQGKAEDSRSPSESLTLTASSISVIGEINGSDSTAVGGAEAEQLTASSAIQSSEPMAFDASYNATYVTSAPSYSIDDKRKSLDLFESPPAAAINCSHYDEKQCSSQPFNLFHSAFSRSDIEKNQLPIIYIEQPFRWSSLLPSTLILLGLIFNCLFFWLARNNQLKDAKRARLEKVQEEYWLRGMLFPLFENAVQNIIDSSEKYWSEIGGRVTPQADLANEAQNYLQNIYGAAAHRLFTSIDALENQYSSIKEVFTPLYAQMDICEEAITKECQKLNQVSDLPQVGINISTELAILQFNLLILLKRIHESLVKSLHEQWDQEDNQAKKKSLRVKLGL